MTGPFGSAAACASLMGLSARQTANAFGIAGSLARRAAGIRKGRLGRNGEAPASRPCRRIGRAGSTAREAAAEGPRNVIEGTLWRAGSLLRGERCRRC